MDEIIVTITKSFEENFLNKNKKYFSKELLINEIKNKNHTFINLHFPYFKFKLKINFVSFRGILAIVIGEKDEKYIIPLNIFLKKDKKTGENISWKKYENKIIQLYEKAIIDLENGDFENF